MLCAGMSQVAQVKIKYVKATKAGADRPKKQRLSPIHARVHDSSPTGGVQVRIVDARGKKERRALKAKLKRDKKRR